MLPWLLTAAASLESYPANGLALVFPCAPRSESLSLRAQMPRRCWCRDQLTQGGAAATINKTMRPETTLWIRQTPLIHNSHQQTHVYTPKVSKQWCIMIYKVLHVSHVVSRDLTSVNNQLTRRAVSRPCQWVGYQCFVLHASLIYRSPWSRDRPGCPSFLTHQHHAMWLSF